jgi:hypothetical protein
LNQGKKPVEINVGDPLIDFLFAAHFLPRILKLNPELARKPLYDPEISDNPEVKRPVSQASRGPWDGGDSSATETTMTDFTSDDSDESGKETIIQKKRKYDNLRDEGYSLMEHLVQDMLNREMMALEEPFEPNDNNNEEPELISLVDDDDPGNSSIQLSSDEFLHNILPQRLDFPDVRAPF